MATQTISISAFQTLCAEVADAIEAEDWELAWKKYAKAEAVNSALETSASEEGKSLARRETLAGLKTALETVADKVVRYGDKDRLGGIRTKHI